ncbi:hypothetical protein GWO68_07940 [Pontibacter sp. BT213]|uniref:Uncharacterized protein n=1 Tax=Pontibacter fetidus TaxID=2700082 RepID=A0A6B2H0L8_9BACT|nr:hypothetical protein [Pontibacter fetidus]
MNQPVIASMVLGIVLFTISSSIVSVTASVNGGSKDKNRKIKPTITSAIVSI